MNHVIGKYWNRNFVMTGIPRSGTSLFCAIVNDFENAVCLNEVWYEADLLPGWFANIRERIWRGEGIPNRYDKQGNFTTNTMVDGEDIQEVPVRKGLNNIVIGSKVNAPYLLYLEKIAFNRIPIVVIVRHPWYTIGSYQSEAVQSLNIANPLTDPRYRGLTFSSNDPIECQAELWDRFSAKIIKLKNHVHIFRYEDLTERTHETVRRFAELFNLELPPIRELENMNIDERYNDMDKVKAAAGKIKTAAYFGYET